MNSNSPANGGEQFLDRFLVLAKHSHMIFLVSAAVALLTFLVLVILPNKYKATARLLPPQQNFTLSGQLLEIMGGGFAPGGSGPAGTMGGMAASMLGLKSLGEVYVAIMDGNTIRDRIIDQFNLRKLYRAKYIEDARRELARNTKITAGRKDNIITVEVTARDPKMAADMANTFITELEKLLQRLANLEAKGRLAFLEKERQQASQNLVKAEEALRNFSEQNSVLQIDAQTRGALEYISRLRAEIDSKEVSIQVLRKQATPFNYDFVRLETEIKGLKDKLRTVECQYDSGLTDVCLPTNKAPGLALEYIRLYREAKFQESLYQIYLKLLSIARMDMARDIAVMQVVDSAEPPEKRSNKRLLPSVLAGMLALVAMIFVAFGREYIQNKSVSEAEAQRLSALKEYLHPWTKIWSRFRRKGD